MNDLRLRIKLEGKTFKKHSLLDNADDLQLEEKRAETGMYR